MTSLLKTSVISFLSLWKKYCNSVEWHPVTWLPHASSVSSVSALPPDWLVIPAIADSWGFSTSRTHLASPFFLTFVCLEGPCFAPACHLPVHALWLNFFMPHPLINRGTERSSSRLHFNWWAVVFLSEDLEPVGIFQYWLVWWWLPREVKGVAVYSLLLLECFMKARRKNWGGISGPFVSMRHVRLREKRQSPLQNGGLVPKFKTSIYNDNPQRKTSTLASDSQIGMADGWPGSNCWDEVWGCPWRRGADMGELWALIPPGTASE